MEDGGWNGRNVVRKENTLAHWIKQFAQPPTAGQRDDHLCGETRNKG